MGIGRRGRLWLGIVSAVAGVALTQCSAASAGQTMWFQDQPTAEQHAVLDYVYDRSPVAAVPYPAEATEAAGIDSALAALSGATEPAASEAAGSEWTLLARTGLVPDIAAVFPDIDLVAGTAVLGWQIGTGVRKLFARLEAPSDAGAGGTWTWQALRWYPKGYEIYFGAKVQQDPGAYLYTAYRSGTTYRPARWWELPCPFSGVTPPSGAHMQMHVASSGGCYVWPDTYPVWVDYPYLLREDIKPKKPIHPYDAATDGAPTKVSPAPSDPGPASVSTSASSFLSSDAAAPLTSEIDWVEDGASDPMSDPVKVSSPWQAPPETDWRRWCERSAPGTGYGAIDQTSNEFTVFETFAAQALGSVDMLLGRDDVFGADGNQWRDIQGFGVRKIAAKHGWSADDELDTAATLAAPTSMTGPFGSRQRYEFRGAAYAADPARVPAQYLGTGDCVRTVVVDTATKPGEPRARGIITSYGRWTGAHP